MFTRTITIEANPPHQIVMYFDSRANASKSWEKVTRGNEMIDDYDQSVLIPNHVAVISDVITNVSEMLRAHGELEIRKGHAELKFNDRVDADAQIGALRNKKMMESAMRNAPRVAVPNNIQG